MALATNPTQAQTVAAIKDLETNKADSSALSSYLPKSGGTMTGAVTLTSQSSIWNTANIKDTKGSTIGFNSSGQIGLAAVPDSSSLENAFTFRVGTTNKVRIGNTNMRPETTDSYGLGTASNQFNTVYGKTIYENGTALSSKYLGISATAADSTKLDGQASSYYLDYNNFTNKPTIPDTTNLVSATSSTVTVAGTSKTTYTYDKTAIYAPNGLIMGGTAAAAGLVTRGICGVSTPTTGGACSKDNLYLNYDGANTYSSSRQVVLQAGSVGTHYGNNLYQYAAARGDAVKGWVEAQGYLTSAPVTSVNGQTGDVNLTIPDVSGYFPKSGGALNSGAVITMTGSNPYIGLQETGGTQYYLQGYQGELGISVGGSWNTKRISLNSSGAVTIPGTVSASSVYATSDRRLKENIKPAELDCGKVIDDLQIKEFNFIADEEKKVVVGAIAQELKAILPEKYQAELVGGSEDTQYTINEGKLLFVAIGALKEEREKTKELEERLARLEELIKG